MRIALISDVYFPRINGVSTSIESFRRGLGHLGVETLLVAPDYGSPAEDGPGLLRIPARRIPFDPEDRLMRRSAALRVEPTLRAAGVSAIHVHTPFVAQSVGVALARKLSLPLVTTYHTLFEEYFHHYVPLLPKSLTAQAARALSRWQCAAADLVIAPSNAMKARLEAYGVETPIEVLPTGIDTSAFASGNRDRFRQRHGIADDVPLALFVGRVAFEKNIEFLLEAARHALARAPGMVFMIAGEGPALPHLKRQVLERGLDDRVRFVGYLERERELPDCYAAADVFVFASRTETQGLVLLEAMACGTPVLGLSCMGTASILGAERGAMIAPDDPSGFGLALATLLNDTERRQQMAREARAFASEWSEAAMAHRLARLYRSLPAPSTSNPSRRAPWKAPTKARRG